MKNLMNIKSQKQIADHIYEMVLEGDITSSMKTPGQFVHVRVSDSTEHVLRRPISIADINHEQSQFTIVYRAEGAGTRKMSALRTGDSLDILSPLGNGYPLEKNEHVLIVGGGIGVPPLYELSKQLNRLGVKTTHVLGFNSKKDVFYEEKFRTLGETHVATADGSCGTEGFVTDVIGDLKDDFDLFYACGPKVMLKVLSETMDLDGYISLEERMGCGFGVCYACVCETARGDYIKLCTEGPVFRKGEIVL
ncbi:dihydroorotate dehydrogenase electron transfer subunit [Salinicoccus halodurans]|uniref:Dihydroorotate dehydrogenase B (NAD(+)), electron transfer subunit n=1 Tax=Salinicoccus halodurans TaxID=407035 RepID=A0A0F7HKQ1_9STAP|nr:dihydroorotate dehydrogenase electron transfer subunit [Salinicoccus halodurans]AKG73723.1 dihydroorotate dehydrogenase [Salinicoccus halodurans]SFK54839.1 dihydroorotate dehydrogenase electron transfer subunit [Salinicoccus halodurans]